MSDNLQEKIKEPMADEAPMTDEDQTINLRHIKRSMQSLACSTTHQIPGYHASTAEELGYCAWIASYLEIEFDAQKFLGGKGKDAQLIANLGKAFCAINQRNQGNKYAAAIVMYSLSKYNGEEVSHKVGELLELLERALITSGDAQEA